MFLSPVDASSDSLYIYLARVSAALLGVGRRDGFSSNNVYTRLLARIASSCFFLQGLFQHLGYLLVLYSQPCLIWTVSWGLHSWGFFWGSMSPTLSEGVTKLLANISNLSHTIWIFFPCLISLVVSTLVSGFLVSARSYYRVFLSSLLSLISLWWQGLQKIVGTALLL